MSTPEHEIAAFLDMSGSEDDPLTPGGSMRRWDFQLSAFKQFVILLKESDDAATDAAMAGDAEAEGGGVLTFAFSSRGYEKALGDLNAANFDEKTSRLRPGGRTYIMPAVSLWQQARDEEFSSDEQKDITREFDLLVTTDGALNDEEQFIAWIQRTDANVKVFFLLHGDGPDNHDAIDDYNHLAEQSHGKVTVYDTRNVTDPAVLARQMVAAIS